jgi:hypothetical protein
MSKFEAMARLGFAGRGLLYLLIGGLALFAGRRTEPAGLIEMLPQRSGGTVILLLLAIGMLSYGFWRLVETGLDLDGHGKSLKGRAVRFGQLLSGLLHVGLGLLATSLLFWGSGGGGGGDASQSAAGTALGLPMGQALVAIAAAGLTAAGLLQLIAAWRGGFLHRLRPEAAAKPWVIWSGRIGYATRGVIFLFIAAFFWSAAMTGDASEAGGFRDALGALGPRELMFVAAGLILFALFSMVEAIYARIAAPPSGAGLKGRI